MLKRIAQRSSGTNVALRHLPAVNRKVTMNISNNSNCIFALLVAVFLGLMVSSSALAGSPARSQVSLSLHQPRQLLLADRIAYQRAVEEVLWRNRIWPKDNPEPKPSLDEIMSPADIEQKVTDYLRNSQALEDCWQEPITRGQLQAEMNRMARETQQPGVLHELFVALGNDPLVVAECLARPILAQRLMIDRMEGPAIEGSEGMHQSFEVEPFVLPIISDSNIENAIISEHWSSIAPLPVSAARILHTATWTGSEMIIWGGHNSNGELDNGWRYYPSTNRWAPTSMTNAPQRREAHTAVWTGREMIIWGGDGSCCTAGRYDPTTDHWTSVAYQNSPSRRYSHTAIWTGSEMIVWGGSEIFNFNLNTGGRYNPRTDTWRPTTTINAPKKRVGHTAVWTGREMIIWSGTDPHMPPFYDDPGNTGGKYDPITDTWTPTSLSGAPESRFSHTAVWSGREMIVWGGQSGERYDYLSSGGRYDPINDSWIATSDVNAPDIRTDHSAVWTGSEMVIWGGYYYKEFFHELQSGARYDPERISWMATTGINAPTDRNGATAIWTGDRRMIIWGGEDGNAYLSSGAVYRLP